jgi:hypothetical protein
VCVIYPLSVFDQIPANRAIGRIPAAEGERSIEPFRGKV